MGKFKKQNKGLSPFVVVKVKNALLSIDYMDKSIDWVANHIREKLNNSVSLNNIKSALNSLEISGVIKTNKGVIVNNSNNEQSGTYYPFNRAMGKIVTDNGKEIMVRNNQGTQLLEGARVSFVTNASGEVIITKTESKTKKVLVGTIEYDNNGTLLFYPQSTGIIKPKTLVVLDDKKSELVKNAIGNRVTVEIPSFKGGEDVCHIRKVFGKIGNPLAEFNALADEAGVIMQRSEKAIKELEYIPTEVDVNSINLTDENNNPLNPQTFDSKKPSYVDLREKMFATIDPDDCQDMDDSVYTEIDKDGNLVTYAAIADVTEYVHPGMALWEEAKQQGFTLYVPGSAFDMLPHELAAGICSLNPNVDRLTMCVKSVIDSKTGKRLPEQTQIMHAVINSKRKFSYNEVQAKLDELGEKGVNKIYNEMVNRAKAYDIRVEPTNLTEAIVLNKKVSDAVWVNFDSRNNLKLASDKETKFIWNDNKTDVIGVEEKPHIPSMALIEALMINANECVAEYTIANKLNSLYRVHGEPNGFKANKLKTYLDYFKIPFDGSVSNTSLQRVIDFAKDKPYEGSINYIIKTMLDRAKYSSVPHPTDEDGEIREDLLCHNALQSEYYSHFTSGIRRFCDLIAQYGIKQHLRGKGNSFNEEEVLNLGPYLSGREKAIDDADQKANDIAAAIYMEHHINDIVDGTVSLITDGRVVIETKENLRIEIPTMEFANGKARVKNEGVALVNDQGAELFKLGDSINVKVNGADRVEGKIYASTDLTKTFTNICAVNAENAVNGMANYINGKKVQGVPNSSMKPKR